MSIRPLQPSNPPITIPALALVLALPLVALVVTAIPATARARSGTPTARTVSARQVKARIQKLRKALLAKRGKSFKLSKVLKAQGLKQDDLRCEGTASNLVVSKLSPKWKGSATWALLVLYKTTMDSDKVRAACWIVVRRVKKRLQWATYFLPGPDLKDKLGKLRWERRNRCVLGRVASRSKSANHSDLSSHSKRTYYLFALKNATGDARELLIQQEEGTVPIIDKRKTGAVQWKRVAKRHFLIHTIQTKEYGGQGGKVTGRSKQRTVYELASTCILTELSKKQVKKVRRLRGGKKIPLPIAGY